MKASALGLTGVMWLWIASGCGQSTVKGNPPDASADGSAAGTSPADGAGGYLAGTGGYLAGTGGATSFGGTTAAAGGAGGQGGAPRLDAGAADGPMGGTSSLGGRAGTGGSGTGGSSAGSPLVCNGSLPGGLPTTRTGGSPIIAVAGDLNGDGKLDLVTAGNLDGVTVLLGKGDGSFAASQTLGGGKWGGWGGPALALADLNGDGHLDLVTIQGPNVRLGKGDGTFAEAVTYPTADPRSVTLGDLNGDGHLDIVAANNGADTVSVLLGKGDGTFAASVDYPAGDAPWVAVIGDLDGDGAPDLVVAASKVVSLLLGKGDGTLGTRVEIQSSTSGASMGAPSAALGDLNGDGKLDILLAWGSGSVNMFLGKGDGKFTAIDSYPSSSDLGGLSVTSLIDLNGDGKLDLVMTGLNVWFGHGDASFGAGTHYTTGTGESATSGVLGDFNGDGILDIAVTFGSSQTGWVRVLLGTGGGAFSQTPTYSTGDGVVVDAFALGDFDGDGILDIATASEAQHGVPMASVLPGRRDGTFAAKKDFSTRAAKTIALGDVNGDGKLDIVNAPFSVLLNQGNGAFTLEYDQTNSERVSLALGDLNGDGKLDMVTANGSTWNKTSPISVLLGQGHGGFTAHAQYASSSASDAVAIGDVNGDGKLDVVVANYGGDPGTQSVSVLLGQGDGTFAAKVDYPSQYPPISLVLGDLNGDGRLDIILGAETSRGGVPEAEYVSVLLGKDDGTFAASVSYSVQGWPGMLALGDVNRDGKPDLVVGGEIGLLLGKGDGTFADTISYPAAASSLALADVNADGKLEVIGYSYPAIFVLNLCQ